MLPLIFKVLSFVRKIYTVPVIKQAVDKQVVAVLRERALSTKNTVDDKLVAAVEVALANDNYKAILNGKKAVLIK